jgi:hypothetical protein
MYNQYYAGGPLSPRLSTRARSPGAVIGSRVLSPRGTYGVSTGLMAGATIPTGIASSTECRLVQPARCQSPQQASATTLLCPLGYPLQLQSSRPQCAASPAWSTSPTSANTSTMSPASTQIRSLWSAQSSTTKKLRGLSTYQGKSRSLTTMPLSTRPVMCHRPYQRRRYSTYPSRP